MKLVNAIDLAIDYDITFENLDVIELLLREFISDYERLYYRYQLQRISACRVTFHLLLHLTDSLRNCGPAWVFW